MTQSSRSIFRKKDCRINLREVTRLWADHVKAPFPSELRGSEQEGVDLVMLDADIAGCVSTFLDNRGVIDEDRKHILQRLLPEAESVASILESKEERLYVERLAMLTRLILDEVD